MQQSIDSNLGEIIPVRERYTKGSSQMLGILSFQDCPKLEIDWRIDQVLEYLPSQATFFSDDTLLCVVTNRWYYLWEDTPLKYISGNPY